MSKIHGLIQLKHCREKYNNGKKTKEYNYNTLIKGRNQGCTQHPVNPTKWKQMTDWNSNNSQADNTLSLSSIEIFFV